MVTLDLSGVLSLSHGAYGTLLGSDCIIKKKTTTLDFTYEEYIENYQVTSSGNIMPAEITVLFFVVLMLLAFGRQPSPVLCFLTQCTQVV